MSKNAKEILAIGGAVGFGLLGLGGGFGLILWGASKILPVLVTSFSLAVAIVTTGVVAAGPIAEWVVPVAAAGVAAAGVSSTVFIVVKVVKIASEETFSLALPILSVLAGFLVDLSKEFYKGSELTKNLFATVAGFVFLVGGILYKKKGFKWKFIGGLLHIMLPLFVLISIYESSKSNVIHALESVSFETWAAVSGLVIASIIILLISLPSKREDDQI